MPLTIGTNRALLRGGKSYIDKVLGYGPIAYWPLSEMAGTVAYDQISSAQNGTYARDVATMTTGAGIGDGNTAPLFDGAADFANVLSASFIAAFSGAVGTIALWLRVANVGIWSDSTVRHGCYMQVDADNEVYPAARTATNNNIRSRYEANTTAEVQDHTVGPTTDWFHTTITWDINAGINGEVKYYIDGAQSGTTDTALGVWAGSLSTATIGSVSTVPTSLWNGYLAHCIVLDRALSLSEIAVLATV